MCRISCDLDRAERATREAVVGAPSTQVVLLVAAAIGAAVGLAEPVASVTWPPVVGLVAGCASLVIVAPRLAWGAGLLAGVVAAAADAVLGHGRPTLLHYGALGALGAVPPALAGAYLGRLVASIAQRVRRSRVAA